MSTKEEEIVCPKCGKPCSWIIEQDGSKFCVHYEGYEKTADGKIRKKQKKHYMGRVQYVLGRPNLQPLGKIKDELKDLEYRLKLLRGEIEREKDEKKKEELLREKEELEKKKKELEAKQKEIETKNIHLRPIDDKERFLKYIKESLELMQLQDDFDEKKIMQVLDTVEDFLKKNERYKGVVVAKLRQIEEDLTKT